ncbi:MAG TPA: MAPEG family protein [Alphaproteobacteria bacterium]|nr:MAPEG family protein [Alphaproteobacteria bacterium]
MHGPLMGGLAPAEWSILAAVLLAYGVLGVAKRQKGFDNANPRDPAFYKSGLPARAQGAHINSLEGLPFFIGAIILAEMHGASAPYITLLAWGYIAARIAYIWAYLGNRPGLRSAVWGMGLLFNIGIFCLPLFV